jgi:hypothetical protein
MQLTVGRVGRRRRYPRAFASETAMIVLSAALGALVLLPIHWSLAVLELAAAALVPVWMMKTVCPYCSLYGSDACPSGYGVLSQRLAKRGDPARFREAFSRNVYGVFPVWFLPIGGVLYMLAVGIPVPWLPLLGFVAVAFVAIPLIARLHTCRTCPRRADCPWGSRTVPPPKRTK